MLATTYFLMHSFEHLICRNLLDITKFYRSHFFFNLSPLHQNCKVVLHNRNIPSTDLRNLINNAFTPYIMMA